MREGAFALIDCLGFKGIWKRADPELLLQKFSKLEQSMRTVPGALKLLFTVGRYDRLKIDIRLLSDTVAISLQDEGREGDDHGTDADILVFTACLITPLVMHMFLEGEPALIFRGCITYGEHIIENNFIVGPAVDEAAEHMNLGDGAFVWLHPKAAASYRKFKETIAGFAEMSDETLRQKVAKKEEALAGNVLMRRIIEARGRGGVEDFFRFVLSTLPAMPFVIDPYRMPIKNGNYLECSVINPLLSAKSTEEMLRIMEKYSAYISGDKLDIWLKNQNTTEFMREAFRRFQEFESFMRSRGVDDVFEFIRTVSS